MNKFLNEKLNLRFPPRNNAVQHPELESNPCYAARNQVIQDVEEQGSKTWKQNNNYHRRSLADTKSAQLNRYV